MYDLDIISAEYFELNDGAYALVMGPWVENDGLVTFYVSVLKPNKHGFRKMPETTIVPAVNYEDAIDNAGYSLNRRLSIVNDLETIQYFSNLLN